MWRSKYPFEEEGPCMSARFDLESLSTHELEQLAGLARRKAEQAKASAKFESLRADVLEAIRTAPADRLPTVLAALRGRKSSAQGRKPKNVFRWDDSLGKNRQVAADGSFVEPAVLMKGRYASTPIA